jgi:hypothetical protein
VGSSVYGGGTDWDSSYIRQPTWLNYVTCRGNETRLDQCSYSFLEFDSKICSANSNVGIQCDTVVQGTYPMPLCKRLADLAMPSLVPLPRRHGRRYLFTQLGSSQFHSLASYAGWLFVAVCATTTTTGLMSY